MGGRGGDVKVSVGSIIYMCVSLEDLEKRNGIPPPQS